MLPKIPEESSLAIDSSNNISIQNRTIGASAAQDAVQSALVHGSLGSPSTGKSYFASLLAQSMASEALSGGSSSAAGLDGGLGLSSLIGMGSGTTGAKDALAMMCLMMAMGQGGGDMSSMLLLLALGGNSSSTGSSASGGVSGASNAYQNASNAYNAQQVVSTGTGNATIPVEAYKAITPGITSSAGSRSAAQYNRVIAQFQVESNERYRPHRLGKGDTYCNIYVWDVTRAMGAEIPHYIDAGTWEAKYYPDTNGAIEMGATRMCQWLEKKGASYGWREVSAEEAQRMANQGKPAVAVMPTHVQMVCPSKDGTYHPQKGVTVAQAGSQVIGYTYISNIYGKNSLNKVKYYAHE